MWEKSVRSLRQQRSGLLCVDCLCEKALELRSTHQSLGTSDAITKHRD